MSPERRAGPDPGTAPSPITGPPEETAGSLCADHTSLLRGAYFRTSPAGVITAVNGNVEDLFGMSASDIAGRRYVEVAEAAGVLPEVCSWLETMERRAVEEERGIQNLEFSLGHDRRRRFFEAGIVLLRTEDGRYDGTVSAMREITRRKQAEERLNGIHRLFEELGPDSERNLGLMVSKTRSILGGAFSLYWVPARDGRPPVLRSSGGLPAGLEAVSPPCGRRFLEAVLRAGGAPVAFGDLRGTEPEHDEPSLAGFSVRSMIGCAIRSPDGEAGILCVADTEPREFDPMEIRLMETLGRALSLEEERRYVHHALEVSENRFRTLFEELPGAIQGYDSERRVTFWNKASERLYGYTADEARAGRRLEDLILPPGMRDQAVEGIDRWIRDGEPIPPGELELMDHRGNPVPVYSTHLLMRDEQGRPELFCMDTDLRELRAAEAELTREKTRETRIVENAPVIILLLDPTGRILSYNRYMERLSGYPIEETRGRDWFTTFLPPGEAGATRSFFERTLSDVKTEGHVNAIVTRSGEERLIEWFNEALPDPDGRCAEMLSIGLDITERTRMEADRQDLERRIQQTQKMESLGGLAGGIAHDFNNSLAAILGNTELAMRKLPEHAAARKNLDAIEKAVVHSADLCRQMLAFSGKGDFIREPLSLVDLVGDTLRLLEVSVSERADVVFEPDPSALPVMADAAQMRQVIMNLVTNAAESTEGMGRGLVRIGIGSRRCTASELDACYLRGETEEGLYTFLRVSDGGCGIPPEDMDRLFDPFFSTKRTGRGLGLPAVLGAVRGHRGNLRIESRPGHGTEIELLLPALENGEAGTPFDERPGQEAARPVSGLVLLVDDEQGVRETGAQMLETLGYEALTARDGAEALSLLGDRRADVALVLLDLTMPRMNGLECLAGIRGIDGSIPVILCSGYTEDRVLGPEMPHRPDGFLQKPFRMAQLEGMLRSLVVRRGS